MCQLISGRHASDEQQSDTVIVHENVNEFEHWQGQTETTLKGKSHFLNYDFNYKLQHVHSQCP